MAKATAASHRDYMLSIQVTPGKRILCLKSLTFWSLMFPPECQGCWLAGPGSSVTLPGFPLPISFSRFLFYCLKQSEIVNGISLAHGLLWFLNIWWFLKILFLTCPLPHPYFKFCKIRGYTWSIIESARDSWPPHHKSYSPEPQHTCSLAWHKVTRILMGLKFFHQLMFGGTAYSGLPVDPV